MSSSPARHAAFQTHILGVGFSTGVLRYMTVSCGSTQFSHEGGRTHEYQYHIGSARPDVIHTQALQDLRQIP